MSAKWFTKSIRRANNVYPCTCRYHKSVFKDSLSFSNNHCILRLQLSKDYCLVMRQACRRRGLVFLNDNCSILIHRNCVKPTLRIPNFDSNLLFSVAVFRLKLAELSLFIKVSLNYVALDICSFSSLRCSIIFALELLQIIADMLFDTYRSILNRKCCRSNRARCAQSSIENSFRRRGRGRATPSSSSRGDSLIDRCYPQWWRFTLTSPRLEYAWRCLQHIICFFLE